jgi:hypothetical protein
LYKQFPEPAQKGQSPAFDSPTSLAARFAPHTNGQYKLSLEVLEGSWKNYEFRRIKISDLPDDMDVSPRFRMGVNMGWHASESGDERFGMYDLWLSKFARAGGGLVRIMMTSWGFSIAPVDYSPCPEISVRLDRGWQLDRVLDRCSELDIAVVLCLFTFDDFKEGSGWDWRINPSSIHRGGHCRTPIEWFTQPQALDWVERLLIAIVARWGAYKCIAAWELFNEVDQVDGYRRGIIRHWYQRIADHIQIHDAVTRPVLLSHANPQEAVEQSRAGAPFRQIHTYGWPSSCSARNSIYWANCLRIREKGDGLISEFAPRSDRPPTEEDPEGEEMRNTLWASLFAGWLTPAWPWYWDSHIEARNLWRVWTGLNKFCVAINWLEAPWHPAAAELCVLKSDRLDASAHKAEAGRRRLYLRSRLAHLFRNKAFRKIAYAAFHHLRFRILTDLGGPCCVLALFRHSAPSPPQCVAWVHNTTAGQHTTPRRQSVVLKLNIGSAGGRCLVRFWDTCRGEATEYLRVNHARGALRIELPWFERDLALDLKFINGPDADARDKDCHTRGQNELNGGIAPPNFQQSGFIVGTSPIGVIAPVRACLGAGVPQEV